MVKIIQINKMVRESNIELLRLILMLFIVVLHGIVHGLGLDSFSSWGGELVVKQSDMFIVSLLNAFLIVAVNTFVLITGYFSINFKWNKIFKLIITVFFYTSLFTTIPLLFNHEYNEAFKSLFILSKGPYWFILDYLFLMIFAPIINIGFHSLDKRKSKYFIGCLLVINCYFGFLWGDKVNNNGYALMQFILMYIIGRYISIYGVNFRQKQAVVLYVLFSLFNGVLFFLSYRMGHESFAWKLTYYNNPLVVISSIMFFVVFLNISVKSKLINYLATSALSIYLIQNELFVSNSYYKVVSDFYISNSHWSFIIAFIVALSLIICLVSIFIDKMLAPVLNFTSRSFQYIMLNILKHE